MGGSLLAPRMESRSDTGGNRVEIQESASSLQLGSGVTKFRIAAAEVGRHFVSSSECAATSRAGISHIAHTGRYICASFFCLLSSSSSTSSSPCFFPTLFLRLTKFRAAADPFCRRGQIEISDDYSVVMYSYVVRKCLEASGANR